MKTLRIFSRDLKCTFRQFIAIWIMFVPVVLAFIIGAATPGAADAPVRVALLRGENPEQASYFERYVGVELFENMTALKKRILDRDDVTAIVPGGAAYLAESGVAAFRGEAAVPAAPVGAAPGDAPGDNPGDTPGNTHSDAPGNTPGDAGGYVIVTQGNEPDYVISAVKTLKTYWEQGIQPDPSKTEFHDFGRTDPPLKITLITALVLIVTVMSGMIISINIVDEKVDRTIRAMRVAPVPLTGFVIGKSLTGVFNSLVCGTLCVLAAGFFSVNFPQALLILLSASFISFVVGFMAGLGSSDFISAMASLKLLLVPFVASILAAELISSGWQWLFYWSPFYWAYDGVKGVLTQTARWGTVLRDTGLTIALSFAAYLAFYPGIKRKLI